MRTTPWRSLLALLTAFFVLLPTGHAYTFLSSHWPANAAASGITMHLQLGNSGTLHDGSESWGQVAETALAIWNSYLNNFQFLVVRDSTITIKANDKKNSVFFSNTVFGSTFGASTLAVTTRWNSNGKRTEADVIFNTAKNWNSYRGPRWGGNVFDFRRVALHEFGHALGLDHPDQNGQSVTAIMNSISSDLDSLQADDINGGQELWGEPLPNLTLHTPTGWSEKLVITKQAGTTTTGNGFTDKDGLYLSFAPFNNGHKETGSGWIDKVYVNNQLWTSRTRFTSLAANTYYTITDVELDTLPPGNHEIKVVLDSVNQIEESNEADNIFVKTITVTAAPRPNLTFTKPTGWGNKAILYTSGNPKTDTPIIFNHEEVFVKFAPRNNGQLTTDTTPWAARVYLNGNLIKTAITSTPINSGSYSTEFYSVALGKIPTGTHTLQIQLDAENAVDESNESEEDNTYQRTITILTPSSIATLSKLESGIGALSPSFSSSTYEYTLNVYNPVSEIKLTPTATDTTASIKVHATPVKSGATTPSLPLTVGANAIPIVVTAQDGLTTHTYTVTVNRSPPAPQMIVEHPAKTGLTSNVSTVSIPATNVGTTSSTSFVIRNKGNAALTGLSLSVSGGNSLEFLPGNLEGLSVAPGASLTFSVRATPGAVGLRTTNLQIASNDPYLSPFVIPITILGTTTVSFASAGPTLIHEGSSTTVSLVRTGSTSGIVSVRVDTVSGTAKGTDYEAISNHRIVFNEGESTRDITVTIKSDDLSEANETFKLLLSDPQDGAILGTTKETLIRIIDSTDDKLPTVSISSPANNANTAEGNSVKVSGKASDDKGIKKVQVAVNGAPYVDASTIIASNGLSGSYTFVSDPQDHIPGVNRIDVKSFDTRDNESKIVTRYFKYRVKRPLVVAIEGSGTLPKPFPGTDNTKDVGFLYSILAKPGKDYVFDHWAANDTVATAISDDKLTKPKLSFVHQEGLILRAHFIPNPFTAAITGTYAGLVLPDPALPEPEGTPSSNETTGYLTATVTSTGAFSGTLKIDGTSLAFKGVFNNNGEAQFGKDFEKSLILTRKDNKLPLRLNLKLDMTGTTSKLSGTVSQVQEATVITVSNIAADRAHYSRSNMAPSEIAGLNNQAYTLLFQHLTSQPVFTKDQYPQGEGYAVGTVKVDGTVTFAGKLADDTKITVSTSLSKTNTWPLYVQLYSGKNGSIAGLFTVDVTADETDMLSSSIRWIRPATQTHWYPAGWPGGIGIQGRASLYHGSPASIFPALPDASPSGNALLTFSDGLLTANLTKNINITPANVTTKADTRDRSFAISINAKTGLITGSFTPPLGAKHTFNGVLFQKKPDISANGYFLSTPPTAHDGTGQSGSMSLRGK